MAAVETDDLADQYFEAIRRSKDSQGSDAVALEAKVHDISPTGNLAITFNKPIIIPPVEINTEGARRLYQRFSI